MMETTVVTPLPKIDEVTNSPPHNLKGELVIKETRRELECADREKTKVVRLETYTQDTQCDGLHAQLDDPYERVEEVMCETRGLDRKILEGKHDDVVELVCGGEQEMKGGDAVERVRINEANGVHRSPSGEC